MMFLALAGNIGVRGSNDPASTASANDRSCKSAANATPPKPRAAVPRNSRREERGDNCRRCFMGEIIVSQKEIIFHSHDATFTYGADPVGACRIFALDEHSWRICVASIFRYFPRGHEELSASRPA